MKHHCSNCIHSEFPKTAKGKIKPRSWGKCNYPVTDPFVDQVPECWMPEGYKTAVRSTDGKDCPCFRAKGS